MRQVTETYSYQCVLSWPLNEKQLAMGETTIGGRRDLYNDDGMFVIDSALALLPSRDALPPVKPLS
ncbi:MAG: hypothetical protein R2744_09280 [Bacteroidales bacterium]